jgi:hypothetical protein
MNSFYVTFGKFHKHSINGKIFDKDCVVRINAEGFGHARKRAIESFGNKFCMISESIPDTSHYSKGIWVLNT